MYRSSFLSRIWYAACTSVALVILVSAGLWFGPALESPLYYICQIMLLPWSYPIVGAALIGLMMLTGTISCLSDFIVILICWSLLCGSAYAARGTAYFADLAAPVVLSIWGGLSMTVLGFAAGWLDSGRESPLGSAAKRLFLSFFNRPRLRIYPYQEHDWGDEEFLPPGKHCPTCKLRAVSDLYD